MRYTHIIFYILMLLTSSTFAKKSQKKLQLSYCPLKNELKKNYQTMRWSSINNNYRSHEISFSKEIKRFSGAQWIGTKVGQLTCIYKGYDTKSFPILLILQSLVKEPKRAAWTKNKDGYRNCHSLNQKQCPFQIDIKKSETNIYQEVESLKSSLNPVLSE